MKRAPLAMLLIGIAAVAFAGGQGEAAGPSGGAAASGGPLEPYDPPLVVSTWRRQDNRNFIEGQSLEDNIWTRAFEEELGIVFEYDWIAPSGEFNAKVNTSIAAGDFPDLMNKLNLEQYFNLARVGRFAPQGDLIEQYDIGEVAKYLDIAGGINRDMMTINGEIYGWGVGPRLSDVRIFAARSDWLEAVGLDEGWNQWLAYWEANGGGEWTAEVNEWYEAR